jgi:hypothetical protein
MRCITHVKRRVPRPYRTFRRTPLWSYESARVEPVLGLQEVRGLPISFGRPIVLRRAGDGRSKHPSSIWAIDSAETGRPAVRKGKP